LINVICGHSARDLQLFPIMETELQGYAE